jgi:translation initiation factor IF-1
MRTTNKEIQMKDRIKKFYKDNNFEIKLAVGTTLIATAAVFAGCTALAKDLQVVKVNHYHDADGNTWVRVTLQNGTESYWTNSGKKK